MKMLDNINSTVRDDLRQSIHKGSKLSIAAACFSIYAYQALKEQLEAVNEVRFIFTSPTFIQEKTPKEKREFYIPRLNRERSLYGTEFEVKLRNELTQKAIAKECADWIRRKARFRSNISSQQMEGFLNVDESTYATIKGFTTVDLGCERGNNLFNFVQRTEASENGRIYLRLFEEIWNDRTKLQDVTDLVVESISAAYRENSPDFIYFYTLYNIFNEFLEDISEDVLPNEATGFKQSKIWNMLYNFQKDAVLAIISKLEKFNGCILADSVGLGKTFTALAVIKYYENRNKSVLVLCPKKLSENWSTYKGNYVNNPIAEDRLRYDVLYHTDLSREKGMSGGIDLARLNWGNYDLVVIDESHNFRNGGEVSGEGERENRYLRLLNKVIRAGVKTKVLMLSATPVNNRFVDLKNQLALAYEGDAAQINDKLNTSHTIDEIFRQAQAAFNAWSKLPAEQRSTEALLKTLDFDFFEVLDGVTIARSRKHIEKYYSTAEIGKFPERLKPISLRPNLTDLRGAINYNDIYEILMMLNLAMIYIDPPYNTGNDFVYEDDFAEDTDSYMNRSGQYDEQGNQLVQNTDSNGRFHTDWLNMIYPRLRIAKDLLSEDGVIFISIDDNEQENLKKICDEVFGETNYIATYLKQSKVGGGSDSKFVVKEHEYCLVYAKSINFTNEMFVAHDLDYLNRYKEQDANGRYFWDTFARPGLKNPIHYNIVAPDGTVMNYGWIHGKERYEQELKEGLVRIIPKSSGGWSVQFKQYLNAQGKKPRSMTMDFGGSIEGKNDIAALFKNEKLFSYPKSTKFIRTLISTNPSKDALILDFFSGSATTAHAVMQLNAEDGGHRKFIMVQLPEACDEKSEAYKAGYKNICEIGKERIRRAGKQIAQNLAGGYYFCTKSGRWLPRTAAGQQQYAGCVL